MFKITVTVAEETQLNKYCYTLHYLSANSHESDIA